MAHGDGLGDETKTFKLIHWVFHNPFCRILYAALHPRWGMGFGNTWSKYSREKDKTNPVGYLGEDKENLVRFAKDYLQISPSIDFFLFGHRHIMLDIRLSNTCQLTILGDWLRYYSYAVFDGKELHLRNFTA